MILPTCSYNLPVISPTETFHPDIHIRSSRVLQTLQFHDFVIRHINLTISMGLAGLLLCRKTLRSALPKQMWSFQMNEVTKLILVELYAVLKLALTELPFAQ